MAQRLRSTAGGPIQRNGSYRQDVDVYSTSSSSTIEALASTHLDPAPKHPLRLSPHPSPSGSHFQVRESNTARRRRRQDGAISDTSDVEDSNHSKDEKLNRSKPTTLDKLEGWLGISTGESSASSESNRQVSLSHSSAPLNQSRKPSTSRSTRLVVVHNVIPTDTLESLALRFNTDVRTLRRANGLWPGDDVLVRKELYIPVEEGSAYDQSGGVSQANEGFDGKLKLLNTQTSSYNNGHLPPRAMSTASASSTSAASHSQSSQANPTWQEVRRIPNESLSHFPPPGSSILTKGKAKDDEGGAFGFGEGLKPGWDLDHGENGVEDLLQLAEKARSRGPSPPRSFGIEASKPILRQRTPPINSPQLSPSSSSRALEEPWKPNKWTFGQKKTTVKTATYVPTLTETSSSALITEHESRGPAMFPSSSYQGWNDIPEPPLDRTAKGQVAHAYKGSSKQRRYPRPGVVDLAGPGTLIGDLASGLPPNSGPASNWARPIGDTLPFPEDAASKNVRNGTIRRPVPHSQSNLGWAQILSDTVRGKMGLEEALERGLEDFRTLTGNATTGSQMINNGTATARRAMIKTSTPPPRPSAEIARVTLAEGQSLPPGQTTITTNGLEIRRSSQRSMLELEELKAAEEEEEEEQKEQGYQKNQSSTWAPSSLENGKGTRRKNIRNVDWLG